MELLSSEIQDDHGQVQTEDRDGTTVINHKRLLKKMLWDFNIQDKALDHAKLII